MIGIFFLFSATNQQHQNYFGLPYEPMCFYTAGPGKLVKVCRCLFPLLESISILANERYSNLQCQRRWTWRMCRCRATLRPSIACNAIRSVLYTLKIYRIVVSQHRFRFETSVLSILKICNALGLTGVRRCQRSRLPQRRARTFASQYVRVIVFLLWFVDSYLCFSLFCH